MATATDGLDATPTTARLEDFDPRSGSRLERLAFGHRAWVVGAAALATAALGAVAATGHAVNADFDRMMPTRHPWVQAWLAHRAELRGLGNALHVAVESTRGGIYDARYLEALREISDELILMPGVDRAWVRSLWTPGVRWSEVTEEGFRGGPVMPDDWDGAPAAVAALRRNVERAGIVGSLVASDARSSVVFVPLLDRDAAGGEGISYPELARALDGLRTRFAGDGSPVRLRVVGFAQLVADLLAGMRQVAALFAVAAAIVAAALLAFTRCVRSTALVVGCSLVAVVWQAGAVAALGLDPDPFSMLVPFLVFATGVSHGAQRVNGILQDVGRGAHRVVAARYALRRLLAAGLAALATDAAAFAVLLLVDVPAVRRMALSACVGVGALVVTSLVLLPVLLSFTGVSPAAAARSLRGEGARARGASPLRPLERLTERRAAAFALAACAALVAAALLARRELRMAQPEAGAPELRASSRYNRDAAWLAARYDLAGDRFAVIVRTPPEGCLAWETVVEVDRLGWALQQVAGVRATASLADAVRRITAGSFEGSPKWLTLSRDQAVLNHAAQQAITRNPDLFDRDAAVTAVVAHLSDHGARTLERVAAAAEDFSRRHGTAERRFLLAAGEAGLEAATQQVVRRERWRMAAVAYAAVALLSLAALRSWRAVLVTVAPLAVTSLLCEALMAVLGIDVRISTLPVIALGVGIPDYALYLLSAQLAHQRAGVALAEAHRRALRFTGRAVALVGATLAAGVIPWAASPIRLQADMGVLLTFMFLANMVAALVMVPALSSFLLGGAAEPAAAQPGRAEA